MNYFCDFNKRPLSKQDILKPLTKPFMGIKISEDDYCKVWHMLPEPSFKDTLYSFQHQSVILIYVIDGYITSSNQYRWISNIKLGIKDFLFIPFDFIDEFYITETTDILSHNYSIGELSKAFKAPLITYPKIMYPATKKELYKSLCWYGKRLIHQEVFTLEVLTATALLINSKLSDKYSNKDLHKKVYGAYKFIDENKEQFSIKLDEKQLKEAHSRGGLIRKDQRVQATKEKIAEHLKSGEYIKPNGKVNLSALAKSTGITRQTIAKYI